MRFKQSHTTSFLKYIIVINRLQNR